MSNKNNLDEIPVTVVSQNNSEIIPDQQYDKNFSKTELEILLEKEKQKVKDCEEKIKHVLADYQNLNRKTQSDIEKGVNTIIDEFMIDFLKIYDDFLRAKNSFNDSNINTQGLDSILRNMDSLLSKYNVTPIDSLGEIFDPNFHEAISVINDPNLDDNTITKEIRKGYISHKRVIRPSLVEISKNTGESND